MRVFLYPAFFIALLVLCSCTKKTVQYIPPDTSVQQEHRSESPSLNSFYSHYNSWQGAPYKKGGLSRRGVDCSGFVYLTYLALYDFTVPRTTEEQRLLGSTIDKKHLKPGDLLFFKTGWFSQHVGIYLEKYTFMHASTTRGVVISNLQEKYWSDNFYLARRISLQ